MTTFAKGRRARTLPLPRHEHIAPIDGFVFEDLPGEGPVAPEILELARALARGMARAHHAVAGGEDDVSV